MPGHTTNQGAIASNTIAVLFEGPLFVSLAECTTDTNCQDLLAGIAHRLGVHVMA